MAVKKRGRPKKQVDSLELIESDNDMNLIQILIDQQKFNQEMMKNMLEVVQQNSSMMTNWFKMFQPPAGSGQKSTTLDDREKLIAGEAPEWEPMAHDQMLSLFTQEQQDYEIKMRDS